MAEVSDFRPASEWGQIRTACHGCRAVTYEALKGDDDVDRMRSVLLPGDGTVVREVAQGMMVSQPCPVCGDSDDPGWLPGFVPPV